MQTTRPRITWKVLPMAQVAILKNIRSSAKRFGAVNCFILVKTSQRLTLYLLSPATDNIHIVLENDNTVLIKDLRGVVNVKFSRNTHLIETSMIG